MDDTELRQYLTFTLGGERFALESLRVAEVLDLPAMTRVPLGPACLRGIVNLRGNAATVVDLGCKLGLGATNAGRGACLIIIEQDYDGERTLLGAMADAVNEVVSIARDAVETPPEMGLPVDPRFLTGLARQGDAFLMLLDLDRLFALEELTPGAAHRTGSA